mgnify:CR=1 FL=1
MPTMIPASSTASSPRSYARQSGACRSPPWGSCVNKGTIVLVGCALGAGALFYLNSSAGASRPASPDATPSATATKELAHSQTTPKPSSTAGVSTTPKATATPTPMKLTITQAKNLPRPAATTFALPGNGGSGGSYHAPTEPSGGASEPSETPAPSSPTPSPVATLPAPPSEAPATATPVATSTPIPTPTPNPNPWPIPTPPTLPPYPDGNLSAKAPSE